jgi:hypothetical protein
MRTTLLVLATALTAAVLLPVAALAEGSPSPADAAHQLCSQQLSSLGAKGFADLYGSKPNAMGKCISKNSGKATADVTNAAKTCKAARAADPAGFAKKWGTNGKDGSKGAGKNAFGKCVSAAVKHEIDEQTASVKSAMATCKAALKTDAAAFTTKYGSAKNALGKCVAAAAKTK